MKLTTLLILIPFAIQAQPFTSASAGLAITQTSGPTAAIEIGYQKPFDECGGGGLIAVIGYNGAVYAKAGKGFVIGYGQSIEVMAGVAYRQQGKVSATEPVYSLGLVNELGWAAWVVSVSGCKGITAAIGLRVWVGRY